MCVSSSLGTSCLNKVPPRFGVGCRIRVLILMMQAFGLGALEEEEAEDDVYGVESMTSYDLTLAGERDISMEQKYGWTGSHGTGIHCPRGRIRL